MSILDQIVQTKIVEVQNQKKVFSLKQLKELPLFSRKCNSLQKNLLQENASGIIAEFKQKSPSKGMINTTSYVEDVTKGYVSAGASGLSVLTDFEYFGGTIVNLVKAREVNPNIPLLRKDFMIDPYQVFEAKAFGADVILLIAACLEKNKIKELSELANKLGMEVLLEVHNEAELEKISGKIDIIGVNNRDLKTFKTSINISKQLSALIPEKFVKITESGLAEPDSVIKLKEFGYKGFLIGETFMKTKNPAEACLTFINQIK